MSQYVEIEIGGQCVARMETNRRKGTYYDICWCSDLGIHRSFQNFNTGIQCQPIDQDARRLDFQNDFAHARRAIAAASLTAKQYLVDLPKDKKHETDRLEVILIHLRTNCFDRGRVTIETQGGGTANIRIEIGTGPIRIQNASPPQVMEFSRVVKIAETNPSLALALQLLDSEGSWILNTLAEKA